MFRSGLWWTGDHLRGPIGQANEWQPLVNQMARATNGCFRTTNHGSLLVQSGLSARDVNGNMKVMSYHVMSRIVTVITVISFAKHGWWWLVVAQLGAARIVAVWLVPV